MLLGIIGIFSPRHPTNLFLFFKYVLLVGVSENIRDRDIIAMLWDEKCVDVINKMVYCTPLFGRY